MFPDSGIAKKYGCARTKYGCARTKTTVLIQMLSAEDDKENILRARPYSLATGKIIQ